MTKVWDVTRQLYGTVHGQFCPPCAKCRQRTRPWENLAGRLGRNYKFHGFQEPVPAVLCTACHAKMRLVRCVVGGQAIQAQHDWSATAEAAAVGHTPAAGPLSLAGLRQKQQQMLDQARAEAEYQAKIARDNADFQAGLARWVDGTRQEFVYGYAKVREIGPVVVESGLPNITAVEEALKEAAVKLGANAYIRFHWTRHYGYSGSAMAVVVVPRRERCCPK
jgi:hypothetical protein